MPLSEPRIALVHDWLTGMRGGERVLEILCSLFPGAPIHTLIHIPGSVSKTIEEHPIHTSFLQNLPFVQKKYRYTLPLMPKAIESFDLSQFDLILSTSHCVAKGCRPSSRSLHISYCHTPMRYIWDQYEDYFGARNSSFLTRHAMRLLRPALQRWDRESSGRVHHFVANSTNVQERIRRFYGRESDVIYPPVHTEFYIPGPETSDATHSPFYLIVSAFVPYKRIDIAIEAFNRSKLSLKIIGSGPDFRKLKNRAQENIEFLGWKSETELRDYYQRCEAVLFTGEEDFGIVPIEAMSCGKPVLAYRKGGACETVIEEKTGIFFNEPTVESFLGGLQKLQTRRWDVPTIRGRALQFSKERFLREITELILNKTRDTFDLSRYIS